MMQSLDGYVAGPENGPGLPMPSEALHWYFNENVRKSAGELYGRRMYEIMRYWDEDRDEYSGGHKDFALAWRDRPKWVVSRTLKEVGLNATLLEGEAGEAVRKLKAETVGDINVAGPELAASLTALGLIDEYVLFLVPVVLGGGKPFFAAGARPELALDRDRGVAGRRYRAQISAQNAEPSGEQ